MKSKTNAGSDPVTDSFSRVEFEEEGEMLPVEPAQGCTRILLVDDHPVLRKGLLACLSDRSSLMVIGEAADGLEAIRKVGELNPDLVLMDVEMPRMNGLAATQSICKKYPQTRVLILSMHNKPEYIVEAIQMGARGFALKSLPSEELVKAIEIVQRGEPFFAAQAISAADQQKTEMSLPKDTSELYEREKEVLIHLAAGFGNREIAEALDISVRTVESHRARLMKKLNIHTIAGLTRYALAHGLVSLNPPLPLPAMAESAFQFPPAPGLRV